MFTASLASMNKIQGNVVAFSKLALKFLPTIGYRWKLLLCFPISFIVANVGFGWGYGGGLVDRAADLGP